MNWKTVEYSNIEGVQGVDIDKRSILLPFSSFLLFLMWTDHATGEHKFIGRDGNDLKFIQLVFSNLVDPKPKSISTL